MDESDLSKIAERISSLESESRNRKDEDRMNDFMGKFGDKFSNDRGIGVAILNKLDMQGVDTSGAIVAAVDSILDDLRTEVNALSSKINKVDKAVKEEVGTDTTSPPDAGVPPSPDMGAAGGTSPSLPDMGAAGGTSSSLPDMGAAGGMPSSPDIGAAGGMPSSPDMGAAGGASPLPPSMGATGGASPPVPPGTPLPILSDERMKKIQSIQTSLNIPANKLKGLGTLSDERFKLIEDAIDAIGAIPEDQASSVEVQVSTPDTTAAPTIESASTETPKTVETKPAETKEEPKKEEFNLDLGNDKPESELDEGSIINKALKGLSI